MNDVKPDIAVTVIGGYLGAGKTTLVNHILRHADERIAVLVNDFGDINIDDDLIAGQDGNTISLANGCICCSLVDGFSAALATITSVDPVPARLVIESSGVADPATVAAYGHGPGLTLDATIVVVDAETIRVKSSDVYVGDTVVGQLRSGDIIVLNKIDLVTAEEAVSLRSWLSDRSPGAVIVDATNAVVDPAVLFGVVAPRPPRRHDGGDDEDHAGPHVHAASRYESWTWANAQPIERGRLETLMAVLPDEVVRAKGIVFLAEDVDRPMVLQRVAKRWSLRRFDGVAQPPSRLVVIGFAGAMSQQQLEHALSAPMGAAEET